MSAEVSEAIEDLLWFVMLLVALVLALLVSIPTPSPVPLGVIP